MFEMFDYTREQRSLLFLLENQYGLPDLVYKCLDLFAKRADAVAEKVPDPSLNHASHVYIIV